jgi:hypothetical protein
MDTMPEHARLASPLVTRSVDRGVSLLRWTAFWSAVVLPLVHVPFVVVAGFTAESTPLIAALWLANAVALVLGRRHSPHGRTRSLPGGDRP